MALAPAAPAWAHNSLAEASLAEASPAKNATLLPRAKIGGVARKASGMMPS